MLTYDSCLLLVYITLVCFDTFFAAKVDVAIAQIILLSEALVYRAAYDIYVMVTNSVSISHLRIST